jgi:iron complex outermembrane receptor protein
MSMRLFLSIVILILTSTILPGQTVPIELTVLDVNDRLPLIGANVWLDDQPVGATNDEGQLTIMMSQSDHVLVVSYIGYDKGERSFTMNDLEGPQLEVLLFPNTTLLNTATVTGSKYEKPLAESSVSIAVLTPELISNTAARTMQEVLDRMPGLQIIDDQANIRGGSGWSYGAGSRVLLLVDDIPILQVDAARPNWADIPMENIGRIEILKGASSALYGSSALNGIINVQTDYAKSDPETHISLQGTSFLMPDDSTEYDPAYTALVSAMHRRKIGKMDLVLGGLYKNNETYHVGTFSKYGRVNANLRYRISDRFVVGVNSIVNRGRSKSFFYWDAEDSFRGDETSFSKTRRIRYNIDPYVKYHSGSWIHKLLGRFYRTNHESDNNQSNESWLTYAEYQTQYNHSDLEFVTTGGVVITDTKSESQLYSDTSFTNTNLAFYLQFDKKFWDRLNVNAGLRIEQNTLRSPEFIEGDTIPNGEIKESRPVVRVGLNYKAHDFTFIRASWGQGYRFPSIAEKFIDTQAGGFRVKPNIDLESEQGWSSEIGVRQGFGNKRWNGFTDLAFFWSEYDNMMEYSAVVDPATFELFFQSQNVGGTRIRGVEWGGFLSGTILGMDTDFQIGYTYIDPQFKDFDPTGSGKPVTDQTLTLSQRNAAKSTSPENILKYRSRHNFKFDLQTQKGKVFGGISFIYVSELLAFDRVFLIQVPGLKAPQDDEKSGYQTLDLRVGVQLGNYRLQLQAKNLMNEIYSARPGYLEAPRNLTLRLDCRV